ncbi:hypothetical protein [Thiolinea disciformis]|uniref:hypothetical protein n=1 Tax=Thiolinea disciformis TaxID=125614 RepID=UPI00039D9D42|nr:hypothetical protein [Thiolinea disciformis]
MHRLTQLSIDTLLMRLLEPITRCMEDALYHLEMELSVPAALSEAQVSRVLDVPASKTVADSSTTTPSTSQLRPSTGVSGSTVMPIHKQGQALLQMPVHTMLAKSNDFMDEASLNAVPLLTQVQPIHNRKPILATGNHLLVARGNESQLHATPVTYKANSLADDREHFSPVSEQTSTSSSPSNQLTSVMVHTNLKHELTQNIDGVSKPLEIIEEQNHLKPIHDYSMLPTEAIALENLRSKQVSSRQTNTQTALPVVNNTPYGLPIRAKKTVGASTSQSIESYLPKPVFESTYQTPLPPNSSIEPEQSDQVASTFHANRAEPLFVDSTFTGKQDRTKHSAENPSNCLEVFNEQLKLIVRRHGLLP